MKVEPRDKNGIRVLPNRSDVGAKSTQREELTI